MTILTAIDGEHVPSRPVEVAYELARRFDEELVVLHVMPQDTFDELRDATTDRIPISLAPGVTYGTRANRSSGSGSDSNTTSFSIQEGEDNAARVVRSVVEETLDERRKVTFQGRVGEPAREIIAEAERRNPRYLVIGGRKRTPAGKALFGSVTQSVLLNADLPVMTVMRDE